MAAVDLSAFGFTPTESLVYGTLLRLGPSTGYGVAREARLARANTYGALAGLVTRGAAIRSPGRPARYRPTDPTALLAHLAQQQGEALDRLSRALKNLSRPGEAVTRDVAGARAVANLVLQLVARAERSVEGFMPAQLWRPTLPAWRRAGERATVDLQIVGDVPPDAPAWVTAAAQRPDALATALLVIDAAHLVVTGGEGDAIAGVWSSHPLIVMLGRRALRAPAPATA